MYECAIELAGRLEHHLFDTLYHALVLEEAVEALITADLRYLRKAAGLGAIVPLSAFVRP